MRRDEVKEKALQLVVDLVTYTNDVEEGDKLLYLNNFIRLVQDELNRHKVGQSHLIRSK